MKSHLAAAVTLAALAGTGHAASGLCGTGETVWFSAAVEGTPKFVSICGSADLDGQGAWLDYRFGKPGNVELQYPADQAESLSAFTVRRYTRPRTTYLKLEFDNDGYNYAILEGYEADAEPEASLSLRVRRISDGTDVAEFDLQAQTEPLTIMRLEDYVTTEPFDE